MSLLKSLPPSNDPYTAAVLVDRRRDPELVRLEEMVSPLDLKGSGKAQVLNWPAMSAKHVAARISELVHYHVAGNSNPEEVNLATAGASIIELKHLLNSEVLPLGLLRLNVNSFKALLFKVRLTATKQLPAWSVASAFAVLPAKPHT